ncbi:MAG: TetR/AcrR family transcriptional regulator [Acidaminococcaceae bacterium]|jgi:AcrR family transcriptional regulator|nr:TetR/AcrR family transcriptional regulator [Acidaminococcaceae bacterium]MCI2109587.1 TetR/AcrR family transcriptional regulator [Acidaminococcaceae bacterium]
MPKLTEARKEMMGKLIKDKIFTEALHLLKEKKGILFTMDDLAHNVGISKGALYSYFTDKQAVIMYLAERVADEMAEGLQDIDKRYPHEYENNLLRYCSLALKIKNKYKYINLANLFFAFDTVINDKNICMIVEPTVKIRAHLIEFFNQGIERGIFKKKSPMALTLLCSSVFRGLELVSVINKEKKIFNQKQMEEEMQQLLLEAVLAK